jgi:DNA anti-recombination protein RmuC
VLSGLHLARLGYTGDPLELARVGNELRALYYSATVFREAFDAAGGDLPQAIRRYNGSGSAAEAYRVRALARIDQLGGFPA